MERTAIYTPKQQGRAAQLNTLQTYVAAASNNTHTTLGLGADTVVWMYSSATLGAAALAKIDGGLDYRDRLLTVLYAIPGGADEEPGGGNDYLNDFAPTVRVGYTGRGAKDAGGINAPSAGNPPVRGSGTSWALQLDTDVWLYASPSDGALYLYNGTGVALRSPTLTITASAVTGKRP